MWYAKPYKNYQNEFQHEGFIKENKAAENTSSFNWKTAQIINLGSYNMKEKSALAEGTDVR